MAAANKKRLEPITDFEEAVLRKGRQEGRQEGIAVLQKAILDILKKRFHDLPLLVVDGVTRVAEFAKLELSLNNALTCASVDEFLQQLG